MVFLMTVATSMSDVSDNATKIILQKQPEGTITLDKTPKMSSLFDQSECAILHSGIKN